MQDLNGRIKAFTKTRDGLRRQADFRHHHQRLFALREHVFQHAQIHFGFTGSGDARQQPGGKMVGGAVNRAYGGGLLGIQTQAIAGDGKAVAPVVKGRGFTGQLAQPFLP